MLSVMFRWVFAERNWRGTLCLKAPKARNMTARGKREARRPW
jgi:hypothetical protein